MEITGYTVLAFGILVLYSALSRQLSLDKTVPPETNPLGVMGQMRQRYQKAINPWWVAALVILTAGIVLVVLSKLF